MPTLEQLVPPFEKPQIIIPPYAESDVWQRNKHKAGTDMKRAIRFISWLNEGLTPEQIDRLLHHDREAHAEALETDELLFYEAAEIGKPQGNDYKENSCGWKSAEASVIALHGLRHMQAKAFALKEDIYREVQVEVMDSTYIGDGEYEFETVRVMTKADILAHSGLHK